MANKKNPPGESSYRLRRLKERNTPEEKEEWEAVNGQRTETDWKEGGGEEGHRCPIQLGTDQSQLNTCTQLKFNSNEL